MTEHAVTEHGESNGAGLPDLSVRGLHVFDLDAIPWDAPSRRPGSNEVQEYAEQGVQEKWLVKPDPDDPTNDRFPISVVRFPPHFVFPAHVHTEGEMIVVLKGTAHVGGRELGPGEIAYNDAHTVYGAEAAGADGCEFLMVRRAYAKTTVVEDAG